MIPQGVMIFEIYTDNGVGFLFALKVIRGKMRGDKMIGDCARQECVQRFLSFKVVCSREEFLDWLCTTEKVLDFKGVPDNMKVTFVSTRLRGRAAAWW